MFLISDVKVSVQAEYSMHHFIAIGTEAGKVMNWWTFLLSMPGYAMRTLETGYVWGNFSQSFKIIQNLNSVI